jgi:hypothetical protein
MTLGVNVLKLGVNVTVGVGEIPVIRYCHEGEFVAELMVPFKRMGCPRQTVSSIPAFGVGGGTTVMVNVAVALNVTRMTLYSWFRGKPIRFKNQQLVEVFTDLVESDTAKGLLPAKTTSHAKAYLEDMIGQKI